VFIGHFAAALVSKRLAPRIDLGAAFVACQWPDLVWPVFLLAGVERARIDHAATPVMPIDLQHMPWSHSFVMSGVWSLAFFVAARARRTGFREAAVLGALVSSHFVLDVLTHRPDMPLAFGETKLGLGLWGSVAGTLAVELGLFAVGVVFYARTTRARDARGRWSLWALIATLSLAYLGSVFGPKPPEDLSTPALAMSVLVPLGAVCAWAFRVDRHRKAEVQSHGG
jgi:hypothetical protein